MNSEQIQAAIYQWACSRNFTAPYGVLQGEHTNAKGTKYRTVTFGYARTLDVSVNIYNRNFIIVDTNRHGKQVFKSFDEVMKFLQGI